jgi:pyridoxal phosphate enzyme (YggS family)
MPTPNENPIAGAIAAIRARMNSAATGAGRQPDEVTLVAVSKTHSIEAIQQALRADQRVFGENRVQEAAAKFPLLRADYPDLRLHIIGPLQTNKAGEAVRLADMVETLDRPRLADALARAADKAGRIPELLVQVNIGNEPQKAGIAISAADDFIDDCKRRFGPSLRGLMCIPPAADDPAPHFAALATLAARHGLTTLSMGMSGDFEAAISQGATHVRIGTAIFGHRPLTTEN